MNEIFSILGLLDWKPWVGTLLLPPVPLLCLLVLAWWWQRRKPALATLLLLGSVLALWFSQCQGTAAALEQGLAVAPSLSTQRLVELRRGQAGTAVVVLGGGVRSLASEYGESHLDTGSMERLHYGLWLARQLSVPVLASGGTGRGQADMPAEASLAARIASRDYGRPLRWVEAGSQDTRGNARMSLPLLLQDHITQVVLVTHGWHMRRALRAFDEEAQRLGIAMRLVPAPMGLIADRHLTWRERWVPGSEGHRRVRQALREWMGLAAGA